MSEAVPLVIVLACVVFLWIRLGGAS